MDGDDGPGSTVVCAASGWDTLPGFNKLAKNSRKKKLIMVIFADNFELLLSSCVKIVEPWEIGETIR